MIIEVAIKDGEPPKERGDLLEHICQKLLTAQHFEVVKELRNTGTEIDLLCTNKTNRSKNIYIECKAYRNKKIDAPTLYKLMGIRTQKQYKEAWLISTSEYGKDAKGIIEEENQKKSSEYSFFTPEKLISALVDCGEINNVDIARNEITKLAGGINKVGKCTLLITKYGLFWAFEYISGGNPTGVLFAFANNSEVVTDAALLEQLSETDTTLNKLNFNRVFTSGDTTRDKHGRLILAEDYLSKILDTGVKFTHPKKENIDIDDIFIFQDLQKINSDKKISSSVLTNIGDRKSKFIIFGDDMSGKTTLAYKLQRSYLEQGLIPVYIDANLIKSSSRQKFTNLINRRIKKQYQNISNETIDRFNRDDIVLIVDDYQNIKINKQATITLNNILDKDYENVIVLSNISKKLELVTDRNTHESLSSFKMYKLDEYGYRLRDEVISKWLSIGQSETIDDEYKYKRTLELSETINTTIGNSFVPTYPIFVLTLLQSFEASTSNSLNGSAYAEFYNYLITHALGNTGIDPKEFGLFYSYLSELAFSFFDEAKNEIEEEGFKKFHEDYFQRKRLERPFEKFSKALKLSKILKYENNTYRFNHNYIYYFFVARFLSEKTTDKKVQSIIESITKRIYLTEFANILLFLVHFSKDQFIFDGIIFEANNIFSDLQPVTFEATEFKNINKLITKEIKVTISDQPAETTRAEMLELKDSVAESRSVSCNEKELYSHNGDIRELDVFAKLNLSFKLVEMLGQLAKNYSELDGDVKLEIIKEAYNLGLRSLKKLMGSFEDYTDILEEEIIHIIESKGIHSQSEINDISSKIVFDFATMISFGFLAKISDSVASKDLIDITEEIYDTDKTISKKLINTAIELDFIGGLNIEKTFKLHDKLRDNNIGKMLLKLFVTKHLYKFNVDHSKRQKVCDKLNIDTTKQKRMLSSKNKHNK